MANSASASMTYFQPTNCNASLAPASRSEISQTQIGEIIVFCNSGRGFTVHLDFDRPISGVFNFGGVRQRVRSVDNVMIYTSTRAEKLKAPLTFQGAMPQAKLSIRIEPH